MRSLLTLVRYGLTYGDDLTIVVVGSVEVRRSVRTRQREIGGDTASAGVDIELCIPLDRGVGACWEWGSIVVVAALGPNGGARGPRWAER